MTRKNIAFNIPVGHVKMFARAAKKTEIRPRSVPINSTSDVVFKNRKESLFNIKECGDGRKIGHAFIEYLLSGKRIDIITLFAKHSYPGLFRLHK